MRNASEALRVTLDTNILLRRANRTDPLHLAVQSSLERLTAQRAVLSITVQSVMEFWVVATRPADVNGLAMLPSQASEHAAEFLRAFTMLGDPPDLLQRWLDLCTQHAVCGRPAHDARLVAVMQAHGIARLLTLNPDDFKRYPEIACLGPAEV